MRRFPLAMSLPLVLPTAVLAPVAAFAQISPTDPSAPEQPIFVPAGAPPAPPPTPASWEEKGVRGIEVQVRFGLMAPNSSSPVRSPSLYPTLSIPGDPTGDILEGKESPYAPTPFGVTVALGYRFLPWLSAGASFSYASFWVNDGTDTGDYADTTSQLERQYWSLAAYARYYAVGLHPRLQPWLELGVGYSDDNASYDRAAIPANGGGDTTVEHQQFLLEQQGLVASLTAGLDWRLAPAFSFGPSLGYSRIVPLKGCATDNVDAYSPVPQITNLCSSPVTGNGYGVFFAGLYVKLTIGPWADSTPPSVAAAAR